MAWLCSLLDQRPDCEYDPLYTNSRKYDKQQSDREIANRKNTSLWSWRSFWRILSRRFPRSLLVACTEHIPDLSCHKSLEYSLLSMKQWANQIPRINLQGIRFLNNRIFTYEITRFSICSFTSTELTEEWNLTQFWSDNSSFKILVAVLIKLTTSMPHQNSCWRNTL